MKPLLLIFFIFNSAICYSQNLVNDGSFEDTIICPEMFNSYFESTLNYWKYSATVSGNTLNSCAPADGFGVPQSGQGFEYSHSGNGYIVLTTFGSSSIMPNARQYAIGSLSSKLVAGKKYKVSMYVSLPDSFIYACNNISIYFSDTIPSYTITGGYIINFGFTNGVQVNFQKDLSNKVGWIKLDTTYTASGYEKWLTIGNFKNDATSETTFVGGNQLQTNGVYWDLAAYFIDDVSVELLDDTGLDEGKNEVSITILPNPNNGSFVITNHSHFNHQTTLIINNAFGQIIDEVNVVNSITNYQNTSLTNGLYFYTIRSKDQEIQRGKFLVSK